MKHQTRRRITLSKHAEDRFKERFPSYKSRDLQMIAAKARYNGILDINFKGSFRNYLSSVTVKDNSKQIRVCDGKVFIFGGDNGHCRTLITLYPVPEQFKNYEEFLIDGKKIN